MARIVTLTQTGIGSSEWWVPDRHRNPFNIGFATNVDGTATYSVEQTYDDILDPTVTPLIFVHPIVAAVTLPLEGTYAFPVAAIRVTITVGTGTVSANFIQAGIHGA